MRHFVAVSMFLLVTCASAAAQSAAILVRHAERADAGTAAAKMTGADPDLSAAGKMRAEALAKLLKDSKITAIYITEYKRTRQTAAPLATALGIEPTVIPSKDTAGLAQKIRSTAGNFLVVGHSNSIPEILKALGTSEPVRIDEQEFDNLFVVVRETLVRLRY